MSDVVTAINRILDVPGTDLGSRVKRVAVILTSPRSGSSLIKSILDAHPDIASLDGEIEPFLALSENGFGYNSDSDAIAQLANKDRLVDHLIDDLTVSCDALPSRDVLVKRWVKRLLLQFPRLFLRDAERARLMASLDDALSQTSSSDIREEKKLQHLVLSKVFRKEPWRIHYYDGYLNPCTGIIFDEPLKIEEPPFVVPRIYRKPFGQDDTQTKTLLFKTPPDVYRVGMYQELFANAEIKYIHLTRGYAQSVNGLMDGWLSPVGFFSRRVAETGVRLSIGGYSDVTEFGKDWWKFDLPPNWREFASAELEEVCLNQWASAHEQVFACGVSALRIAFEEFVSNPAATICKITDYLDLPPMPVPPVFPMVMAVEAPKIRRWEKRQNLFLMLGKKKRVRETMSRLGYRMDPATWL